MLATARGRRDHVQYIRFLPQARLTQPLREHILSLTQLRKISRCEQVFRQLFKLKIVASKNFHPIVGERWKIIYEVRGRTAFNAKACRLAPAPQVPMSRCHLSVAFFNNCDPVLTICDREIWVICDWNQQTRQLWNGNLSTWINIKSQEIWPSNEIMLGRHSLELGI